MDFALWAALGAVGIRSLQLLSGRKFREANSLVRALGVLFASGSSGSSGEVRARCVLLSRPAQEKELCASPGHSTYRAQALGAPSSSFQVGIENFGKWIWWVLSLEARLGACTEGACIFGWWECANWLYVIRSGSAFPPGDVLSAY